MTTEAQFLGNDGKPRRYAPGGYIGTVDHAPAAPAVKLEGGVDGRSLRAPKLFTEPAPEEPQLVEMLLEAEKHATNALLRLQDAELDAGIAYLQSALAFAQNYRHAIRTPEAAR